MPDTFIKNNMSIVLSFLVAVFTAGGVFAEFTAIKNELTTVHERLDKKIKVISNLEDRILDMEKQLEYERGFLEAAAKKKKAKPSKVSSGSISMYLAEIGQFNPLPPEREVELAIKIQNNDERAMKELVEANLRFVVSVAKKYQGNGLSLADIINEGNMGLIKAAKRFDHTRGCKFISYAVWWIRQSIRQA